MAKYISLKSNGVFFLTAFINAGICYALFGPMGATIGVITVLFSNIIYEAKEDSSNELYLLFLLSIIPLGGAAGYILKLSVWFYLFLFAVSYFYYIAYNKDPYLDRLIPFFVIFSCMGTTLSAVSIEMPIAYLTGVFISLTMLTILRRKAYMNGAFRNGLFARELYKSDENLLLRALIFSVFLFASLAIPNYFDLYRVYWAPLTFVVLLRPKEMDIVKTTLYRFIGSFLGAIFVFGLIYVKLSQRIYLDFAVLAVFIFLMPTFLKSRYAIKTFGITTFVLLLIEETEFLNDPTYLLPYSRVYETFIGGAVAVAASVILKMLRTGAREKSVTRSA